MGGVASVALAISAGQLLAETIDPVEFAALEDSGPVKFAELEGSGRVSVALANNGDSDQVGETRVLESETELWGDEAPDDRMDVSPVLVALVESTSDVEFVACKRLLES